MSAATCPAGLVRQFRQVLLWPLRLMTAPDAAQSRPWQQLGAPWQEVVDEYTGHASGFHERHYNEFVAFLPYVQRILYGEGRKRRAAGAADGESPMRVYRRRDVAAVRVQLHAGAPPLQLQVVHIDLYFFYDVDVVLLNVEVESSDLSLLQAQELLYRFGRAFPSGWTAGGEPLHSLASAQWLDAEGRELAASDALARDDYLAFVSEHRAPRIAAHWAWLLQPIVPDHSDAPGALRFRQIEYYRMPVMAWLALDAPQALTRSDFVRLGLVTGAGGGEALPYAEQHLSQFEQQHCYDRFWTPAGAAPFTRYLGCGHALVVVGPAASEFYRCGDRGVLAQFRHQHFLLFLIAHFQKAALLMFSDRLVEALERLDIHEAESVKRFKRAIRTGFESFLRFTHRYWFRDISEQAQTRALFRLTAEQLQTAALYAEVKEQISDMNAYLDTDSLRRQANTVLRLTVVTIFGLIGTVTTGFLGMNLIAAADDPLPLRLAAFGLTIAATIALTMYTIVKSKALSDFLDAVSDERLGALDKLRALGAVWRRGAD